MEHINEPIVNYTRKDFPILDQSLTVGEALERIRREGLGEKIVYFYAVNPEQQLVGVIPTRRLLTSGHDTRLEDIMIRRVISIPAEATVLDAAEFFVLHKFMAFPVVDDQRHIIGIVDVTLFTEEVYDLAERQQLDDLFQFIGLRLTELRHQSPLVMFGYRFRWLLATLASGLLGALLVASFEVVLEQALVLAFFLALILGLGESVSMQSMSVALQQLHVREPTWDDYLARLQRELPTGLLLGGSCGLIVGVIALAWRGDPVPAGIIGGSILLSLVGASLLGLSIPMLLHALRLDPKIAAGPLTLALVDLLTLFFYFTAALIAL